MPQQQVVIPAIKAQNDKTIVRQIADSINEFAINRKFPDLFTPGGKEPVEVSPQQLLLAVFKKTQNSELYFQVLHSGCPSSMVAEDSEDCKLVMANLFPIPETDKSFLMTCYGARLFILHVANDSCAKALINGKTALLDEGWHVFAGDFDLDFGNNKKLNDAIQMMANHYGKSADEMSDSFTQFDLVAPIIKKDELHQLEDA